MVVYTKVPNFVTDLTALSLFKSQLARKIADEAVQFLQEVRAHLEACTLAYKQQADQQKWFVIFCW